MQIWAESGKSALPICNYSQILYQFLTFTQNLKRSHTTRHKFPIYGFSGYQNVNSGSQRDNKFFFCKRIITIQNVSEKYITPQDFLFWGVF